MKVVHVETGRHLYGGAQQVLYLLEGLRDQGVDNLLAYTEGSRVGEKARALGIAVEELACTGEFDLEFLLRLRLLLRQTKPDLTHLHSRRGADTLGLAAARWAGTPAIISRRVDNAEPGWLARWKYRQCAHVICISEGIQRVLLAEGVPANHISCVRSAVQPDRFRSRLQRSEFLQELQMPEGTLVMAVVAQLIERKNHIGLLRALAAIDARLDPRWRLAFFGQGPLEQNLRNAVANLNLQHRVFFAGFHQDMPALIGHIDLLVHPALMEGLGVSLIEAAAAGVPIIGNPVGGIPEICRHGENGLLVDCSHVDKLADALLRLVGDSGLREEMGAAGKSLVSREFSVEAMVQGNLAVYRQLMGSSPGSGR